VEQVVNLTRRGSLGLGEVRNRLNIGSTNCGLDRQRCRIHGRPKQSWVISTWYALLQPHVLMQHYGYTVRNVHTKAGLKRPHYEEIWLRGFATLRMCSCFRFG